MKPICSLKSSWLQSWLTLTTWLRAFMAPSSSFRLNNVCLLPPGASRFAFGSSCGVFGKFIICSIFSTLLKLTPSKSQPSKFANGTQDPHGLHCYWLRRNHVRLLRWCLSSIQTILGSSGSRWTMCDIPALFHRSNGFQHQFRFWFDPHSTLDVLHCTSSTYAQSYLDGRLFSRCLHNSCSHLE